MFFSLLVESLELFPNLSGDPRRASRVEFLEEAEREEYYDANRQQNLYKATVRLRASEREISLNLLKPCP